MKGKHRSGKAGETTDSLYFLGRPIPNPMMFPGTPEGDQEFVGAISRIFYDLVLLTGNLPLN